MKNLINITTLAILFSIVSSGSAYAIAPISSRSGMINRQLPPVKNEMLKTNIGLMKEKVATVRAEIKEKASNLKKEMSYKEIDRRIESMNKISEKINSIKRLTPDQKSTLVAQVTAEIAKLTALRSKIAADTDLKTLQADKKSIVDSYRIYALFMPKMTIIAHADATLNLVEMIMSKSPTGDALNKITEAKTKAQSAIDSVISLTPDGYPGNKTNLEAAKRLLQEARISLTSAHQSLKAK